MALFQPLQPQKLLSEQSMPEVVRQPPQGMQRPQMVTSPQIRTLAGELAMKEQVARGIGAAPGDTGWDGMTGVMPANILQAAVQSARLPPELGGMQVAEPIPMTSGNIAASAARSGITPETMRNLLEKASNGTLGAADMTAVAGVPPAFLPTQLSRFPSILASPPVVRVKKPPPFWPPYGPGPEEEFPWIPDPIEFIGGSGVCSPEECKPDRTERIEDRPLTIHPRTCENPLGVQGLFDTALAKASGSLRYHLTWRELGWIAGQVLGHTSQPPSGNYCLELYERRRIVEFTLYDPRCPPPCCRRWRMTTLSLLITDAGEISCGPTGAAIDVVPADFPKEEPRSEVSPNPYYEDLGCV